MTINATSCLLLFPAIIYDMQMSTLYSDSDNISFFGIVNKTTGDDVISYNGGIDMNSEFVGHLLQQNNPGKA